MTTEDSTATSRKPMMKYSRHLVDFTEPINVVAQNKNEAPDDKHYSIYRKEPMLVKKGKRGKKAKYAALVFGDVRFDEGLDSEGLPTGLQDIHLLIVLEDRLKMAQSTDFACKANKSALKHIQKAIKCIKSRAKQESQ